MPNPKKPRPKCLACGKEPDRPSYKYCSNKCQLEYQRNSYIKEWKAGRVKGLNTLGLVTTPIKRYLRDKYGNKCCVCSWSRANIKNGIVPLVADHIDGNWRNNIESNLRLVCPNCDAISPTFAALNRGRGRVGRAISKRSREVKLNAGVTQLVE